MNTTQETSIERPSGQREIQGFESPIDVDTAAQFLRVGPSLAYSGRVPLSEDWATGSRAEASCSRPHAEPRKSAKCNELRIRATHRCR